MKKPIFDKSHIAHPSEDEELEGIDFAWFEIEYLFIRWMIERDRRKNAHKGKHKRRLENTIFSYLVKINLKGFSKTKNKKKQKQKNSNISKSSGCLMF